MPAPVLPHGPLGPDHRVVAPGLAAFVLLGVLIAGHDGHQPPASERKQPGDLTAPAQHPPGDPGGLAGGDPQAADLLAGDVEEPGRVR